MYPVIMLLLVDQKCSIGDTTYISSGGHHGHDNRSPRIEPMTAVDKTKACSGMGFIALHGRATRRGSGRWDVGQQRERQISHLGDVDDVDQG